MAGGPSSVGRSAAADDVPAVTACLSSAFYDDPVWGRWTFPEPASRAVRLYGLMRFWVVGAIRYPWVRMTDAAEAVAVWLPPGASEMTSEQEDEFEAFASETLGPRAHEVLTLFELFDEHHPEDEPHYYLSLWATHRDHAGRGLGTALLLDNLARIDAERMSAYLESTNPANVPRYEALGFQRRGEFGPAGGPVITTMWRDAR
jgi:ribosomal protein S18 acetylase RimI-like enzyme